MTLSTPLSLTHFYHIDHGIGMYVYVYISSLQNCQFTQCLANMAVMATIFIALALRNTQIYLLQKYIG